MTRSTNHIDDDALSALVDNQLSPGEAAQVRAHLESCSTCLERSEGFRSVAEVLRGLPDLEPPRDFQLGPRLVADPPNVIRLRRWYAATRGAAASLAAVFVFLSLGTLYVGSRPASTVADASPAQLSAPAPAIQNAAPAAPKPTAPAPRQASPAPAAGAAAAARPAQANPEADDQVAAATSVNPLPTPVPTPVPLARSVPVPQAQASVPSDPAAPLRTSAVVCGLLAVIALLAALVARHRLQGQSTHY